MFEFVFILFAKENGGRWLLKQPWPLVLRRVGFNLSDIGRSNMCRGFDLDLDQAVRTL